ncbi:MAG: hypothetical protein ABR499_22360 [Gemmatimonadaceae bacterium]
MALADVYGRLARRADRLGAAGVVGGIGVGVLLLAIAGALGWPDSVGPWLFGLGWVIALGSTAVVWQWFRRGVARYNSRCPACDARVLESTLRRAESSRVQLAVAMGKCPSCGADLVTEGADD